MIQHGDCPSGKIFRAAGGKAGRKLQHQVCAAGEGGFGAGILVHQRRIPPLHEITAHYHNDIVGLREKAGLSQMICMTKVKRVVFCNNSTHFHDSTLSFLLIVSQFPGWQPAG